MEAVPPEDPVQLVTSFYGWICAMRKPRAFCDEFFVAGAALYYNCQICVARKFVRRFVSVWDADIYSGPR
jgi:hypothetical protein